MQLSRALAVAKFCRPSSNSAELAAVSSKVVWVDWRVGVCLLFCLVGWREAVTPGSVVRNFCDECLAALACACNGGLIISSCTRLSRRSAIASSARCVSRKMLGNGLGGRTGDFGLAVGDAVSGVPGGVPGGEPAPGVGDLGSGVGFRRAGSLSMVWGTSACVTVALRVLHARRPLRS
jgi:hypothetical protein